MQPANALASTAPTIAENFLELGGQNGARNDNFKSHRWLQPSPENSRQMTVCYAAAKTAGGKSPAILGGIGETAPFAGKGKCWDPIGFTERTTDPLMLWYRAAELKHSRVAMLACTGWLVNQYELYFPGNLAAGKAFSSLGKNPLEAWAATPYDGKVQILFAIGLAEFHSEFGKTAEGKGYKQHFTRGGPVPGQPDRAHGVRLAGRLGRQGPQHPLRPRGH